MNGQRIDLWSTYLGIFLVFASMCVPAITLNENIPSIHILDFSLPIILCFIALKGAWKSMQFYVWIPFIFAGFILTTMWWNIVHVSTSDYFEVYKWFKYGCAFLFFSQLDFTVVKRMIPLLFLFICLLNVVHFLELFGINDVLEKYYNGGIHLQFFGKDSDGGPAVKRLVGTMGNPNINAILFGLFSIYFFPIHFERKKVLIYFLSILFVFLCQSRTALLVLLTLYGYLALVHAHIWTKKQWMLMFIGLVLTFLCAWMFATSFFQYTSYNNSLLDGSVLKSGSARGRLETWKLLGEMILQKPLLGHGPFKQYFYEHKIYSENEYILMTWRYGLVGLMLYLSIFLIPLKKMWKDFKELSIQGSLLILLMLVSALTNNPFTERNIELLFCVGLAWVIGKEFKKEKANAQI